VANANVQVEQKLRRQIVDGTLPVGSTLPPERELAVKMGVSRLTLRAALATLAASGLVSARQGSGYVIRDFRRTGGSDLLEELVRIAEEARLLVIAATDLFRIRRHLAAAVLENLAQIGPTGPDRDAFDAAVNRFAAAAEAGASPDELAELDLAVVGALLDCTRSSVLKVCLNPIAAVVATSPTLRAALYREPWWNIDGWRALGSWLARPDGSLVHQLVAMLAAHDEQTLAHLRATTPPKRRTRPAGARARTTGARARKAAP
jgi:DNA-binding FadR family transcriptional regulator